MAVQGHADVLVTLDVVIPPLSPDDEEQVSVQRTL